MTELLNVWVDGIPLPKGSGSRMLVPAKGSRKAFLGPFVEMADMPSAKRKDGTRAHPGGRLKRWTENVRLAALAQLGPKASEPFDGPVTLHCTFYMPRPQKPKYTHPAVKPDIDKLCRSIADSLSGVAYHDDCLVCELVARKVYTMDRNPGVVIHVRKLDASNGMEEASSNDGKTDSIH